MKKKYLLLVVIALLLVTGCGKDKKLSCSKNLNTSGLDVVQQVDINFNGSSSIKNMKMSFLVKLPDEYKPYINSYYSQFKNEYEKLYGKYENVKVVSEKKSDTEITVDINFDYKNMTKKEKKTLGFSNGSEKYSINKSTLERQGFYCD